MTISTYSYHERTRVLSSSCASQVRELYGKDGSCLYGVRLPGFVMWDADLNHALHFAPKTSLLLTNPQSSIASARSGFLVAIILLRHEGSYKGAPVLG